MDYNLKNISSIDIGSNELLTTHTLNRNFQKLLVNDIILNDMRKKIYQNRIKPWDPLNTYQTGDVVWYKRDYEDRTSLYILRSLKDDNNVQPYFIVKNNKEIFNDSGWEDLNEYSTIFQDNLSVYIGRQLNSCIQAYHELESDTHKYGILTSETIDQKVLKNDMSNIDSTRDHLFYPYQTKFLDEDYTILNGYYRKWDNGTLEYDIVYQLGYTGETMTYNNIEYDVIKCNTLELEDDNYFNSTDDKDIFKSEELSSNYVLFNNHIETNRNWFVNTYSSKIELPFPFKDTDYMIFGSDIRRQERNTNHPTIDCGINTITYTNKTESSFYPVYIMYANPGVTDPRKSGLIANNFHCHLIGRWK